MLRPWQFSERTQWNDGPSFENFLDRHDAPPVARRNICNGGGGGKSGSTGTTYSQAQTQIPPEVMARYNAVNARAEAAAAAPWQPYTGEMVAPVNQVQTGGIDTITGAAGVDTPYFSAANTNLNSGLGTANNLYGTAGGQIGSGLSAGNQLTNQGLDTAGNAYSGAQPYSGLAAGQISGAYGGAQSINQQALGLATGATGAVNPGALDVNQYMSPYNQSVVQSTLGLLRQQQDMDRADLRDSQIMSGAFGGDRAGVGDANLRRQQDMAYGNVAATLNNQNFQQALAAAQQQQGVGLAAGQANRAALNQGAQTIAGIGQQGFGQGLAAAQGNLGVGNQIYSQGQGLAAAQMQGGNQLFQQGVGAAGANTGLAGGVFGTASGAAGLQGQLGTQQMQNQIAQGQAQLGAGTVQQQTQQALDTAKYQQFMQEKGYPFQVAQFLANIALGTGAQSGSTTTSVQSSPTPYFSDERLKENIHIIGRTHDGQPIARFNYKGDPSTQIGLLAQEVEKKHPDAVGLAGGYKTVDYDAATRDSIHKAGGGGLSAGNDNFLEMHRGMFPYGNANAMGIPTGEGMGMGAYGVPMMPIKATPITPHKLDAPRPQESGLKRDLGTVNDLYSTGKGLASAYGEAKDALVGTAGKNGAEGSGGLFGKDGKWNPNEGWWGRNVSNSNEPKITVSDLAAPGTADAGLASGADTASWADGWGTGSGTFYNSGGRIRRQAGGAMPYGVQGYIPDELYQPKEPEKLDTPHVDTGDRGRRGDARAGGSGGAGKAVGSLVGAGLGSMVGVPWLGSMIGGFAGGMFKEGGRVGLAGGGAPDEEDLGYTPIPGSNVLPFTPMSRKREFSPIPEGGLATRPDERGDTAMADPRGGPTIRYPLNPPLPDAPPVVAGGLPGAPTDTPFPNLRIPPVNMVPESGTPGPLPPRLASNMAPESGTSMPAQGLAGGHSVASGGPSVPILPDGTPIVDDRPAGLAAASPAAPPVPTETPTTVATAKAALPGNWGSPERPQGGRRSDLPYDPANPGGFTQYIFGGESDGRNFNNPRWPIAQGGPDGPAQFTRGTWQQFVQANPQRFAGKTPAEIDAMRRDPGLSAEATSWYANKNAPFLQQAGVPLTYGNLYMAHMLDGKPAATLLANPSMNAVQALKAAGLSDDQARRSIVDNGGTLDMSAGQFALMHKNRLDGQPTPRPQSMMALNDGSTAGGGSAGLMSGADAAHTAAGGERPDFLDRAGSWIERNQRPIMSGLAFIGNMLGSQSRTLAGSIGDGLAAAAPFYMNTGFKETELAQANRRIDITERAQYLSVLAQLQAMQASNVQAGLGRNPEIDRQIAGISAMIAKAGGVSPVVQAGGTGGVGGTGGTSGPAAPRPSVETTELAPKPAAAPAGEPTQQPGAPVPASNAKDPHAMPVPDYTNAAFRAQIQPEMNPDVWRQRGRELANINPERSTAAFNKAHQLETEMRNTGRTVGKNGEVLWVPGWMEEQAARKRLETNPGIAEKAREAATARERMRQQVDAIRDVTRSYETGALNSTFAEWDAKLKGLGLPGFSGGQAADYQKFMKEAAATMIQSAQSMPAGHGPTDALRQQIATSFAAPTLDPEANRKILANTYALLNWADRNYTDTMNQLEKTPHLDMRRFYDDWQKSNPLERFTKEADKDSATRGMELPKTMADVQDGRLYVMTPQDVFRLMRDGPNRDKVKIDDIKKNFGGKPSMTLRAKRDDNGNMRLVPE